MTNILVNFSDIALTLGGSLFSAQKRDINRNTVSTGTRQCMPGLPQLFCYNNTGIQDKKN